MIGCEVIKSAPLLLVGRYEPPAEQRRLGFSDIILPDMAEEAIARVVVRLQNHV
jgi:hypothetical protein